MAKIIRADGTIDEVQPKNGKNFDLKELQKIVGGFIETVGTRHGLAGHILVINEDGRIDGSYGDPEATGLYKYGSYGDQHRIKYGSYGDPEATGLYKYGSYGDQHRICGDVLLCKDEEAQ